ncbi:MAG: putative Zn-dependent peptidase, partial [Acidobacteria bacterium]|nr:putative Zn-dependent peptidase [Acidobacteriota bacterium]
MKPVLDLVAEVLQEPSFPQNEFDELKQLALASLENSKSEPQNMASRALSRHISPYPKGDVRYSPTLEETMEDMKALKLEEVQAFYKEFFGASDSQVTAVGDFDPAALQKQVTDLFGRWRSPKKYARVDRKYQKLPLKAEAIPAPDKANAMWIAVVPFRMTDTDPDYPAMTLAGYIFGSSGMNSHLFARIRGKEGLSYGVGGQFAIPIQDDMGLLYAYAICAPQNAPKVEAAFKDELNLIMEKGFTPEEVDAAK